MHSCLGKDLRNFLEIGDFQKIATLYWSWTSGCNIPQPPANPGPPQSELALANLSCYCWS